MRDYTYVSEPAEALSCGDAGQRDTSQETTSQRLLMASTDAPADKKTEPKNSSVDQLVRPMALDHQRTNPDKSVVKFDEQGRPSALFDKDNKLVHEFTYKDKDSIIPESIKLANGTVLKEEEFLGLNGAPNTKGWTSIPPKGIPNAFLDSKVSVNDDGTFNLLSGVKPFCRQRQFKFSAWEHGDFASVASRINCAS